MNKVILVGNLGKDPETRSFENGTTMTKLRIATNEWKTDVKTKEKTKITDWHNVVVWGNIAENCAKYLKSGSKVLIEGKIKENKFTDKNGIDRVECEIIGDTVEFLDPAPKK